MAPPRAVSAYPIACPFCCLSFRKTPNLARHVQTSHKNESRCAAAAAAAAAISQSFERGSVAAMAGAPGPALLDADATVAEDTVLPSPAVIRTAGTDAGAPHPFVVGAAPVVATDAAPDANAVSVAANMGSSTAARVVDVTAAVNQATAGTFLAADDGSPPPNELTTAASGGAGESAPPHEADNVGDVLVGEWLYDTDD